MRVDLVSLEVMSRAMAARLPGIYLGATQKTYAALVCSFRKRWKDRIETEMCLTVFEALDNKFCLLSSWFSDPLDLCKTMFRRHGARVATHQGQILHNQLDRVLARSRISSDLIPPGMWRSFNILKTDTLLYGRGTLNLRWSHSNNNCPQWGRVT